MLDSKFATARERGVSVDTFAALKIVCDVCWRLQSRVAPSGIISTMRALSRRTDTEKDANMNEKEKKQKVSRLPPEGLQPPLPPVDAA